MMRAGESIAGYTIVRVLASGGDPVYVVLPPGGGKDMVLKILSPKKHGPENPFEIDAGCRLDHPNVMPISRIINLYRYNMRGVAIVSEKAAGTVLDLHQRSTPMELKMKYLFQTILAVHFLHNNHYIHLDIKDINVFITDGGVAKLADFGFSYKVRNSRIGIKLTKRLITIPYAPPESLGEKAGYHYTYNDKSDIWTLGHYTLALLGGKIIYPPGVIITSEVEVSKFLREVFSKEQERLAIIRRIMAPVPHHYSVSLIPLINRMFSFDRAFRPSIEEIVNDPVFNLFWEKTPRVDSYLSYPSRGLTINVGDGVPLIYDYMRTKWGTSDCRFYFLAVDLYYRAVERIGEVERKEVKREEVERKEVKREGGEDVAVAACCMWLACKMNYDYSSSVFDDLVSFAGVEVNYMEDMEANIIVLLGGIMYPDYIYEKCGGKADIIWVHKNVLFNPQRYNTVDLDSIRGISGSPPDGNFLVTINDLDV